MYRSWQDSNLQSSDSKSDALSIRPHDLIVKTWGKLGFMKLGYCEITLLTAMHDLIWFVKKVGEKLLKRACAPVLISIDKSALLSRQTRSMTPICRLVKGYQNWYATSSGQPGDQSSVFYIIDIDWRWDQKLLLYFRLPAGRDQYCPQRMIQREKLGTLYLTLYISIIFFSLHLI